MKILLGYYYYPYPFDIKKWVDRWLLRVQNATRHEIQSYCLTLNPPGRRLTWKDLDARWKRGDKELLSFYENMAKTADDFDVFINWNGINLHPDFVRQLPVFKVYGCFDDPEQSEDLSKPVAASYDLCLVGNIAEIDTYHSWGVDNVEFWPMGFFEDDYNPALTKEDILNGTRDTDISLICERENPWRTQRLDAYVRAFPDGSYYGKGWPNGFLPESNKVPFYQRTKIGPNFHNSTGPINFRTYVLPANGVMQLCDNKRYLGKIFELNKEVAGFDSVEEAIDLTKYYLSHDDERRAIAAAGWEKACKEYNEIAVFEKAVDAIKRTMINSPSEKKPGPIRLCSAIRFKRLKTVHRRIWHSMKSAVNLLKGCFRAWNRTGR